MEIKEILLDEKALAAVDDGVWIDDIPDALGVRLKVRGWSSEKVQSVKSFKERRASRKDRDATGALSHAANIRIVRELVSEAILLDWEGITDGGKPVPYSKDLARKWLTSREGDRFLGMVSDAAKQVDFILEDSAEDLEKNSQPA